MLAGLVLALLAADTRAEDHLNLAGTVKNTQGKGIKDVAVEVTVNGQPLQPLGKEADVRTGASGSFAAEFTLPAGTLPGAEVKIQASKPAWRASGPIQVKLLAGGIDGAGNHLFYTQQNLGLERQVTPAFWLATLILLVVYLIIALEWLHRTLAALLGATLMLFLSYTLGVYDSAYFILSFEDAMHAMDMNVVFLLLGMMIIVGVIKKTGMFQWLAYKSYALARGNVFVLAVLFMWITAIVSAFLDNVTTMLLMIPVTIEIALTLKINPITFLIPEVFASNVGGTATLIGDPPNILIGSYANLTFGQFAINLTGICTICMIITAVYYVFWYKKDYLQAEVKDVQATIASLREEYRITDRKLLNLCLWLLGLTIFLFIVHGMLHMQPSVAALTGAMLLLVLSRVDIVEMLEHEVEWPTLVFFMALFIVIAGAEETGLIQFIAEWVRNVSGGSLMVAIIMVLWVSAIASAFIDNIPFTATMLPIVAFLNQTIPGADSGVLWWSLALGACLGGNGTMIGASANVVTVGMMEKAGYQISFLSYMKACFVPMLITVTLCMIYLLVAY
ncbi:MAG: citrate transporter [Deltaproteobacteria bacterium RBG_13_60_28]|nr:MAG: citrate transporter [Deltaproteobacteria bacterium RBG_13_60_28]